MGNGNSVRAGMTVAKTISYYAESVDLSLLMAFAWLTAMVPIRILRVMTAGSVVCRSSTAPELCEEWSLQAMELPLHYRSVGH